MHTETNNHPSPTLARGRIAPGFPRVVGSRIERNETVLLPYFEALVEICRIVAEAWNARCQPEEARELERQINPFYSRTTKGIYLCFCIDRKGNHELLEIATPFGKYSPLNGGVVSDLVAVSHHLLTNSDLELRTVSVSFIVHAETIGTDYRQFAPVLENFDGFGSKRKWMLLCRCKNIHFDIDGNHEILNNFTLRKDSFSDDEKMLKRLREKMEM